MNELGLMEKFSDPALIDTLTVAEKSIGAMITTLMGMGITFAVLILLWGLIALMAKFTAEKPKTPSGGSGGTPVTHQNAAAPAATTITNAVTGTSPELIAVITAAIAAFEGTAANAGNLIIRKINRISGQTTTWSAAGSSDAIASRKF